jgi:hypothetical protein
VDYLEKRVSVSKDRSRDWWSKKVYGLSKKEKESKNDARIKHSLSLFMEFRKMRFLLSKDYSGLEVKHDGKGVIS